MPYPVQTVNAFSEAELWYIYQQLVEINVNANDGLTQQQIFELFNGTNPQGKALSLFENQTVNKTSIADILYFSNNYLNAIDNNIGQIENWTDLTHTYLSTIRTPFLTSITGSLTIAVQIHNLSVYNSGASAGTINVDGGGAISIPAGVTVNFDAGGNNNRYAINKFVLNATGTTFIVSYTA